jgi:4,5-DOPA dioxygenase extradiol
MERGIGAMVRVSSIFVSHGAPTLLIEDLPVRTFLKEAGQSLGRPEAIVAFSAHSVSDRLVVSGAEKLRQVYDFWGFPSQLYDVRYEPPGSPLIAESVVKLLEGAHIEVERSAQTGIDHGMWVPLSLMYPNADVPVVPVTINAHMDPQRHLEIGEALRPLQDREVLIVASGGLTHNLGQFGMYPRNGEPPEYVSAFADWAERWLTAGRVGDLVRWREIIPHAARNHPTPEHFIPLFVAMGAGSSRRSAALHRSYAYGVLAMDSYSFH